MALCLGVAMPHSPTCQSEPGTLTGLFPAPASHSIIQTRRGIRNRFREMLYNLTGQVYFSNYVLSILFIVYTLSFKVDTLKTKTMATAMPKMYQLFLIKGFFCVQLSPMVSQLLTARMDDI